MSKNIVVKKLLKEIISVLSGIKATNIKFFDLKNNSSIADYIIVSSGNSSRHVNSIVNRLSKDLKKKILSVEGIPQGDWALVDFGDIILHIFRSEIREHYNLEKLYSPYSPNEKKIFG